MDRQAFERVTELAQAAATAAATMAQQLEHATLQLMVLVHGNPFGDPNFLTVMEAVEK